LRIPQGTGVDGAIPSRIVAAHRGISAAGQKLARIAFTWDTGLTSANLTLSLYAGTYGLGPADIPFSTTFNIAGGTVGRIVDPGAGSSAWTNGRNWPILRFHYTAAAGTVTADSWWLEITDLVVRTMMYARTVWRSPTTRPPPTCATPTTSSTPTRSSPTCSAAP
jgi:hypothetical protein